VSLPPKLPVGTSFTVALRSAGPAPALSALADWLVERGEPFAESAGAFALRAVPVHLSPQLVAQLEIGASTDLPRLVDLLHGLSLFAGADLVLDGKGPVSRAQLWLALADEQDRARIATALRTAREHGDADEIHRRLWEVVASLRPGRDARWDAQTERIVELHDVGAPGGTEAEGTVSVPVDGWVHSLVWRWLSAAYPRLDEP
jgi:hypothetical protein